MPLNVDSQVPRDARPAATYAAAVLHALAREEAMERRPERLLEANHATWKQFRGRLGWADLLDLVIEDAAVTQPSAFATPQGLERVALPHGVVKGWLGELEALELKEDGASYIGEQAKRLGVPTRMARSDLHRIQASDKVLELPGSGGQLAYHLVTTHDDVYLQDAFTIACSDWRDATLAGLVAVEVGLSGTAPVVIDGDLAKMRAGDHAFDYVVGLERDKGGLFKLAELQEWFPKATVLLV